MQNVSEKTRSTTKVTDKGQISYIIFTFIMEVAGIENITEWQLFHIAQAVTRAKRLEKHRTDFHEELYECIVYPTVHYDMEFMGIGQSPATDIQAIKINEAKERYGRKIQKEYDRYVRWEELLNWVDEREQHILIRYFQKKKYIQPKIINRLLSKVEQKLAEQEKRIEQERTAQSIADFRAYQEVTKSFRKAKYPVEESDNRQQYLIKGRFVYMTPEEYEAQELKRGGE